MYGSGVKKEKGKRKKGKGMTDASGVVQTLPWFAGDVGAHVPGAGAGEEGDVAELCDLSEQKVRVR